MQLAHRIAVGNLSHTSRSARYRHVNNALTPFFQRQPNVDNFVDNFRFALGGKGLIVASPHESGLMGKDPGQVARRSIGTEILNLVPPDPPSGGDRRTGPPGGAEPLLRGLV